MLKTIARTADSELIPISFPISLRLSDRYVSVNRLIFHRGAASRA
jgi:hypothetical protein